MDHFRKLLLLDFRISKHQRICRHLLDPYLRIRLRYPLREPQQLNLRQILQDEGPDLCAGKDPSPLEELEGARLQGRAVCHSRLLSEESPESRGDQEIEERADEGEALQDQEAEERADEEGALQDQDAERGEVLPGPERVVGKENTKEKRGQRLL